MKLKKKDEQKPELASPEMEALNAVEPDSRYRDYTGNTVVLYRRFFGEAKDSEGNLYRMGDRRFHVSGGFGAHPGKIGSAVFGYFLVDGESSRIDRGDIEGTAVNQASEEDRNRHEKWEEGNRIFG